MRRVVISETGSGTVFVAVMSYGSNQSIVVVNISVHGFSHRFLNLGTFTKKRFFARPMLNVSTPRVASVYNPP